MNDFFSFIGEAPQPRRAMPPEPIVRTAQIEGPYRWFASRAWNVTLPTVFWIMLNPSLADGRFDDPTMKRVIEFSHRWGFGSAVVGNVYPFISPDTAKLHAWRRGFDHKSYEATGMREWPLDTSSWSAFCHNQHVLSRLLALALPEAKLVAAWGNGVDSAELDHFLSGMWPDVQDEEFGTIPIEVDWWCLGKTKSGAPIHPLARGKHRVPNDATLQIWKRAHTEEET